MGEAIVQGGFKKTISRWAAGAERRFATGLARAKVVAPKPVTNRRSVFLNRPGGIVGPGACRTGTGALKRLYSTLVSERQQP
jgi:hypothetical protein